jgi:hypothetical protein
MPWWIALCGLATGAGLLGGIYIMLLTLGDM